MDDRRVVAKVLAQLRDYGAHCFDSEEDFEMIIDEFSKGFLETDPKFSPGNFHHLIMEDLNKLSLELEDTI